MSSSRSREVKTPLAIASYTQDLFKLKTSKFDDSDDSREGYGVTLLFPKSVNIDELKAIASEAAIAEWPNAVELMNSGLIKKPFLDGDGPQGKNKETGVPHKGYPGHTFIRCTSGKDFKPTVVDRQKLPVVDVTGCPSGSQVYAVVNAYTWVNKKMGKGVSFGISLVQVAKVAVGDEILGGGGGPNPDRYFDAIADEGDAPKETKTGKGAGGLFG